MRQYLSKILSITLSFTLLTASLPVNAAPAATPAFVKALTPPEQFGSVVSFDNARGAKMPRLVVVADLHAHLGVQRNIMGILEKLVPTLRGVNKKKVPVFLEGGWLPNLEEPLKGFSNSNVRRFMNEYYLHKAELGGAQAYSEKIAGSQQVTLLGVEDKEEYLANKAIFAQSYPARKQVLEALKFQEAALSLLQDSIEGRSYRKLQSLRQQYNEGRLSADNFAKKLVRLANRFHINDRYVAVLKNLRTADPSQVEVAFSQVHRNVSAQLAKNRPWTSFLRAKLHNEADVRLNLAKVTADMDLLKRLVANQLTPSEVTLAMSRIADLEQTAELLLKDQPVAVNAKDVIRQSLEFYPMAFLRDETLVKNSLKSLEPFGTETTGILVAGGFHTDAIAQYLKERQIPYLVIHPNVSRDVTTEEHLNYVKRMGNEHVSAGELQSDLADIRSGRLNKSTKSSVSFFGAKEHVVQPGDKLASDGFFQGYPALKNGLEAMPGDAYDQAVKAMDAMGLDVNNSDRETMTLVTGADGKYHVQGQEDRPSVIADLVNDRFAGSGVTRPETLQIDAIPDKEAILTTGGEADYTALKDRARIRMASSRFRALTDLAENKPFGGSREEANAIRAINVLQHETAHAAGQSEANTIAAGLAQTGRSVAMHLGDEAVGRIANAILPQVQAGKATQAQSEGIMQKVSTIFTPKALKSKSVQEVAVELAGSLPGATPEQVAAMMSAYEGSLVLAAAQRGHSGPLRARLAKTWRNMRMTATNA
jgi:hypothetical protein